MNESAKRWAPYLLAVSICAAMVLAARALNLDQWLLTGLNAFLATYGLRVGIMTARLTGRRTFMYSGSLFSAGAALLMVNYAHDWEEPIAIGFAAAALVLMVVAVGLSVGGQGSTNSLKSQ